MKLYIWNLKNRTIKKGRSIQLAYVTPEEISKAKQLDLLSWMQQTSPQELVHISLGTYCTREHNSLKISNGKWHWFSRGIGGKSALDYLIKVQNIPFTTAVKTIVNSSAFVPSPISHANQPTIRDLLLPEPNGNNDAVMRYLIRRGIHHDIIDYCISRGLIYESAKYHNAVFLGLDTAGEIKYASLRGTTSAYKGEASGSNKRYSFSIAANPRAASAHIFESAIDLMSYATLLLQMGQEWKRSAFLSLAGVYKMKRDNVVPVSLSRFLDDYPNIKTLYLHLDNDEAGRRAAESIIGGLKGKYEVINKPPPYGKDVNDYLMLTRNPS